MTNTPPVRVVVRAPVSGSTDTPPATRRRPSSAPPGRRPATRKPTGRPGRRGGGFGLLGRMTGEDVLITAILAVALLIAIYPEGPVGPADLTAEQHAIPTGQAPAAIPDAPPAPAPAGAGCTVDDPTSDGCLTPAAAHALAEIERVFDGYRGGPKIRAATCWSAHAWNPSSDHPKGRACDLFPGPYGEFAEGADLAHGWELAEWLRAHAEALQVRYVIWQGRIWSVGGEDRDGWGRPYTGGGVYDIDDPTGGHWDHVHVSFAR